MQAVLTMIFSGVKTAEVRQFYGYFTKLPYMAGDGKCTGFAHSLK